MNIFLICPVREMTAQEELDMACYIAILEKEGHQVHWPPRDVDQNDPIGLRICSEHREAMLEAHEIHIWWNKKSQGSLFDFGMAFAFLAIFRKKIVLANQESIERTPTKSFNNVLLELHNKGKGE